METFPSKNIAITWVEKGSLARNLFLSFGFAIVTALSAQIRIELPNNPCANHSSNICCYLGWPFAR